MAEGERDYSNERGAMCWSAQTWRRVDIPVSGLGTWPMFGYYYGPRVERAWVLRPPDGTQARPS